MAGVFEQDSDVYFGGVDEPLSDWRGSEELVDEVDPDDELLHPSPPDVVSVLGFDPLEFEEEM